MNIIIDQAKIITIESTKIERFNKYNIHMNNYNNIKTTEINWRIKIVRTHCRQTSYM